jgi:hypothetical protein
MKDTQVKKELVAKYGEAMTTPEAMEKYTFLSFLSPYAFVERKEDGVKGTLEFTHRPRFYFKFVED